MKISRNKIERPACFLLTTHSSNTMANNMVKQQQICPNYLYKCLSEIKMVVDIKKRASFANKINPNKDKLNLSENRHSKM